MNRVATATPLSPVSEIAADVAIEDASTFTALLPTRIAPISRSLFLRSFSTIWARLRPLRASWRMRASDAAVRAVSALEKKADRHISNIMTQIMMPADSKSIIIALDSV